MGQSAVTNAQLTTHMTDVGAFVGARAKISFGDFDLSGGLRAGGLVVQQTYTGSPAVTSNQSLAPYGAVVLRLDWQLWQHFFIGAEASLRGIPVPMGSTTEWRGQPLVSLGLGFKL